MFTLIWWRIHQNLRGPILWLAIVASLILGMGHGILDGQRFADRQSEFLKVRKGAQDNIQMAKAYCQVTPTVLSKPDPSVLIAGALETSTGQAARLQGIFGEVTVFNPYTLDNPFLYYSISGGYGGSVFSLHALFALALTFRVVATDRRVATIRLLLTFGIGRTRFLVAEWVAALLTLLLPFSIGLTALLIVSQMAGAPLALLTLPVLSLVLLSGLTTGGFAWLGLWISSHSKTARAALTISIVIWALAAWVWPSVTAEIARVLQPISMGADIGHESKPSSDSLLVASLPIKPSTAVQNWSLFLQESRPVQERGREQYTARQRNILGQQYTMYRFLSCISPIAASRTALSSVCGSGGDGVVRFLRYCNNLNERVANWQRERITIDPQRAFILTNSDPPLIVNGIESVYEYEPTQGSFSRLLMSLIPLILVMSLSAIGAIISFNRKSLVAAQ